MTVIFHTAVKESYKVTIITIIISIILVSRQVSPLKALILVLTELCSVWHWTQCSSTRDLLISRNTQTADEFIHHNPEHRLESDISEALFVRGRFSYFLLTSSCSLPVTPIADAAPPLHLSAAYSAACRCSCPSCTTPTCRP